MANLQNYRANKQSQEDEQVKKSDRKNAVLYIFA